MSEVEIMEEKKKYGKYENYEIEHLADKMIDIEVCKADKNKMKYVLMCLEDKKKNAKKSINSIEGLIAARQNLKDEDGDDS